MVKSVQYYACDKCEKGKLNRFAATQHLFGNACGDGGENAEFWECDKCGQIYYRHRYSSGNYMGNDPDNFDKFSEFKYSATKIEILLWANKISGYYSDYNNNKIIESRGMILKKIIELKEKIYLLKNISSLKQIRKGFAKSKPVTVGSDGLFCLKIQIEEKNIFAWCDAESIEVGDEVIVLIEEQNYFIKMRR